MALIDTGTCRKRQCNEPAEPPTVDMVRHRGASPVVTTLNDPSSGGGKVIDGQTRKIGPGDVVIIPPNTPHWFTEITSDQIVYLVVRVDPRKVLPAGYGARWPSSIGSRGGAWSCFPSPLAIRAFTQQPVEDGRERPFVCDRLWRGSG